MKILNISDWNRKEHFEFFSRFEEPFFGVCVDLDFTIAYQTAKALDASFFLYYLHKALAAVNATEPFRYRIDPDNKVIVHDVVSASATINRENGTFGFSYMPFSTDFANFEINAKIEIERIRNSNNLFPVHNGDDVIHCSALPWLKFTSLSHARSFSFKDSVPKLSFGKMTDQAGSKIMPVSIHVHHALMDGLHVGQFVERFQAELDMPA